MNNFFCFSCGKESEFKLLKEYNMKPHKYCIACEEDYTSEERKRNQKETVLKLLRGVDL